jgi:hypothetical protein
MSFLSWESEEENRHAKGEREERGGVPARSVFESRLHGSLVRR